MVTDETKDLATFSPSIKCLQFFISGLFVFFVWFLYSISIEILPMQQSIRSCPSYANLNERSIVNYTQCNQYLISLNERETVASTFWSLMAMAGWLPWIIINIVAYITTTDSISKGDKAFAWSVLGCLICITFITLFVTSFYGSGIYIYIAPAFLGTPLVIIIPGFYIFLTRVNEFFKSFSLNIYLASLYYMITTPLILMNCFIIWEPKGIQQLYTKGTLLLGCGYFFAWLVALILSGELFVITTYRYVPNTNIFIEEDVVEKGDVITETSISTVVANKTDKKEIVFYYGQACGFTVNMVLVSWLSLSNTVANIIIITFCIVTPVISYGLLGLQIQE